MSMNVLISGLFLKEELFVIIYLYVQGGCVDSSSQGIAVLLMALGDKDVSKVTTGPLSPNT